MATATGPARSAGRFERWRAGWRVALRMARRDVRRHRGRSALIVVLVGLPVLLLTAGSTLWFTDNLNPVEQLPFEVGRTQGFVTAPQPYQLRQLADPMSQEGWPDGQEPPAAVPLPGVRDGHEQDALEALLGADLLGLTSSPATAEVDGHFSTAIVLGADLSRPEPLSPRVTLETGRWPREADEVVVTAQGLEHGLPASGTMTLTPEDPERNRHGRVVTVVGTGRAFDAQGAQYLVQSDLVTRLDPDTAASAYASRQWLVDRPQPLTWSEIEKLNTYGVAVYSRHVTLHPETVTRRSEARQQDDVALLVVGSTALGLLLLTTLLAGPAFAVSAARQRRTLALAASNGATTAQLRRSVLGQALVLGVLSALVGAGSGVAAGVGCTLAIRMVRPDLMFGPLEIPWPAVALVAAAAVVSSVVAALIPSRGLGRLDIVTVLRGQAVSPRLRRRVPAVGAVLAAAGAAAVTWAALQENDWVLPVFLGGAVSLVVGALMVVPLVLSVFARVADRLPLPLRMAAREAGRQRGRATPTVAAIMAGAAVLAVVAVALQADTVRQARDHIERVRPGQGYVPPGPTIRPDFTGMAATLTRVERSVSTLTLQRLTRADDSGQGVQLVAQRPGCTLTQTLLPPPPNPPAGESRCQTLATNNVLQGASIAAADLDELDRFLEVTTSQRRALEGGALAIVDPEAVRDLPRPSLFGSSARTIDRLRPVDVDVTDGAVTFARYVEKRGKDDLPLPPASTDISLIRVPVVLLTHEQWMRLVVAFRGDGGLLTTQTAAALGLAVQPDSLLVRAPGGISPELETRLNDVLQSTYGGTAIQVERGFQRDDALMLAILFGVIGLVILVATLIATALSQAENAPLLGTLAAVGATRATRRALAGVQAAYLGLLGSGLGLAVGLVPGVAIARLLTATYTQDGLRIPPASVELPWLQLVLPLLAVPLVAGLLAWVSIRRAPTVTRRAT